MKADRTARQKQALVDAYKILTAEFDDVLLVTSLKADFHQDALATDPDVYWQGNWLLMKGLAGFANNRIEYTKRNKHAPR